MKPRAATPLPTPLAQRAVLALYVTSFVVPVVLWAVQAERVFDVKIVWSSWALLVLHTALLAAAGALLATLLGTVQALLLELFGVSGRRFLRVLLLVPFVTPAAVLTTAWHAWLAGGVLGPLTSGPLALVLLSALQMAPVVAWLVTRHLHALGAAEDAAVRLALPPWSQLRCVYLPAVRGVALRGGMLIFLLLLPAREIAGYAGVETAGDRILAAFTAGGGDLEGWTLVATFACLALLVLPMLIRSLLLPMRPPLSAPRQSDPPLPGKWATVLLWGWVASWLLPLVALTLLASSAAASTADVWGEGLLFESVRALLLAMLLTSAGWVLAAHVRVGVWLLLLAPLVLPGSLPGLALTTGVQHWLPAAWTDTPLLISVAQFVRFVGVAALLGRVARDSVPQAEFEAALLLPRGGARTAILIRRAWPVLAACVCVCFALCLGEVESTALLVPPGYVVPVIELHQFLHFRHDAHAAQLATGLVGVVLLVAIVGMAISGRRATPTKS
ncbi:MAG: hypothetical protein AAF581_19920 [Planctomycetota bacterium]